MNIRRQRDNEIFLLLNDNSTDNSFDNSIDNSIENDNGNDNEHYINNNFKGHNPHRGFNRRVHFQRKFRHINNKRLILVYVPVALLALTLFYFILKFLLGGKKKQPDDPMKIMEDNINYLNSLTFSLASRTYEVPMNVTNLDEGKNKGEPLQNLTENQQKKKKFNDELYPSLHSLGFYYCDEVGGPITVDLNYDDGSKVDLRLRLHKNSKEEAFELYRVNKTAFDSFDRQTPTKKTVFCEIPQITNPETIFGYTLQCPTYYTLRIEQGYFGLHQQNDNNCLSGQYIGPKETTEKEEEDQKEKNKNQKGKNQSSKDKDKDKDKAEGDKQLNKRKVVSAKKENKKKKESSTKIKVLSLKPTTALQLKTKAKVNQNQKESPTKIKVPSFNTATAVPLYFKAVEREHKVSDLKAAADALFQDLEDQNKGGSTRTKGDPLPAIPTIDYLREIDPKNGGTMTTTVYPLPTTATIDYLKSLDPKNGGTMTTTVYPFPTTATINDLRETDPVNEIEHPTKTKVDALSGMVTATTSTLQPTDQGLIPLIMAAPVPIPSNLRTDEWICDSDPTQFLRDHCEGKNSCIIKPMRSFFGVPCLGDIKHLEVQYHCEKEQVKQPRIAIITFVNRIGINSIYENAISELYQYARIHGYDFFVDHDAYDTDREIYYMKTNTLIKYLMKFLEEKTYDWIFWVDSDTLIVNPNLRLETFLPPMDKSRIHLIISNDGNGLNAGVFFLRVHPWSLNYMIRASAYAYYHPASLLYYSDQASMNNVLYDSQHAEDEHFVIVPQHWFNMYLNDNLAPGYLLFHFAGIIGKDVRSRITREYIQTHPEFYEKTSEEMRKEVEEFYKLPSDKTLTYSI